MSNNFSPRFLAMFPWLFDREGRTFETDPDDPGNFHNGKFGGTKYGIDFNSHPDVDIRNLTEDRAMQIYWDEYWQKNHCEELPFPMGECYFDTCVNNGAGRAAQLLSISASAGDFLQNRIAFYKRLAARRPKSQKYLTGWLNRVRLLMMLLKIPIK